MKEKTGRNWRLLIAKNSILMLVMLVVIFLAASAWYYAKTNEASATGISAKTDQSGGVQLALPYKGSYPDLTEAENPDPEHIGFFDKINFSDTGYLRDMVKDVTGDGKKFIIPSFDTAISTKDGRTVVENGEWVDADSSKTVLDDEINENDNKYYYVALDFYARSKNPKIDIKEGSFLAARSEIENKPLKSNKETDLLNPSTVGENNGYFSADAIVGAMRVSLVGAPVVGHSAVSDEVWADAYQAKNGKTDWDLVSDCRFLWLPRPDLFLNTYDNMKDWNLTTGVKVGDKNNVTYKHSFYKAIMVDGVTNRGKQVERTVYNDKAVTKKADGDEEPAFFHVTKIDANTNKHVVANGDYKYPTFGQNVKVEDDSNTIVKFKDNENYYLYKFRLNIWIEGDDAEARRAMSDGEFKLNLVFG